MIQWSQPVKSETRKAVRTVDEAAAAYGGMPELSNAFGLTMAKGRANSVERWQLTGVPRYYHLGLSDSAPRIKFWTQHKGDLQTDGELQAAKR